MSHELHVTPSIPPAPIDPAPRPAVLGTAALIVSIGGWALLALAANVMGGEVQDASLARVIVGVATATLLLSLGLFLGYWSVGRRRRQRYERRVGFLPRERGTQIPDTGRTTLYRLEYGRRGEHLCLMLARWKLHPTRGWRRTIAEHVWVHTDDPEALGAERARLSDLGERLEEEADSERLLLESSVERLEGADDWRVRPDSAARFAEKIARDPR